MTRLDAGILALLDRGPHTTVDLALALKERTVDVQRSLAKLHADDVVEHTPDGWKLTQKVAA